MTIIAPPPTLPMGTVTHRYLGVAQDGSDTDTAPDLHLLSGVTGTISPDTGRLVHTVSGVSTTLERLPVKIRYDAGGNLVHLDPRNDAPLTGALRLPANDATVAPTIGYVVQWSVPMAGGKNRTWQGHFELAAGGTVDLGTVALQSVSGNPDRIYADLMAALAEVGDVAAIAGDVTAARDEAVTSASTATAAASTATAARDEAANTAASLAGEQATVRQALTSVGGLDHLTGAGTVNVPARAHARTAAPVTLAGTVDNVPSVTAPRLIRSQVASVTAKDAAGVATATVTYSPALSLRAAGDVRDTLNEDGTITRRVGVYNITGTGVWSKGTTGETATTARYYLHEIPPNFPNGHARPGHSDRFPVGNTYDGDTEGFHLSVYDNGRIYLRIRHDRLSTADADGLKAWFAANPTVLYYPLATPTVEAASTLNLPLTPGGTITAATEPPSPAPILGAHVAVDRDDWSLGRDSRVFGVSLIPAGAPAAYQDMHAMYDQLVAAHPDYITARTLGTDATGNPIREYTFGEPTLQNSFGITKPTMGLLSGLHGNEKGPAVGLHRFMSALAEREAGNELLSRLRAAVTFSVIPVGNPSGWNADTRQNSSGVNLNRNFTAYWSTSPDPGENPGTGPASEPETELLEAWMVDLDYFIDCHWSDQVGSVLTWAVVGESDPATMQKLRKRYADAVHLLSSRWPRRWSQFPKATSFGRVPAYNPLAQSHQQAAASGAESILLETIGPVLYTDTSPFGSVSLTVAAETIGNTILSVLRDHI